MAIAFRCPCGRPHEVHDSLGGGHYRCGACGLDLAVPGGAEAPQAVVVIREKSTREGPRRNGPSPWAGLYVLLSTILIFAGVAFECRVASAITSGRDDVVLSTEAWIICGAWPAFVAVLLALGGLGRRFDWSIAGSAMLVLVVMLASVAAQPDANMARLQPNAKAFSGHAMQRLLSGVVGCTIAAAVAGRR